jgi:hypothetical protein
MVRARAAAYLAHSVASVALEPAAVVWYGERQKDWLTGVSFGTQGRMRAYFETAEAISTFFSTVATTSLVPRRRATTPALAAVVFTRVSGTTSATSTRPGLLTGWSGSWIKRKMCSIGP